MNALVQPTPLELAHEKRAAMKAAGVPFNRVSVKTYRDAIAAKCKDCIHDTEAAGSWYQQVSGCEIQTCPLWPVRYQSKSCKKS